MFSWSKHSIKQNRVTEYICASLWLLLISWGRGRILDDTVQKEVKHFERA